MAVEKPFRIKREYLKFRNLYLIVAAVWASVASADSNALLVEAIDETRWGTELSVVDSVLMEHSDITGFDSLGIKRYAGSLFGFSCELIPVADSLGIEAMLIRFHVSDFHLYRVKQCLDSVTSCLTRRFGKPEHEDGVRYSDRLPGFERRHSIWSDSLSRILLLQDRDLQFVPLLDLLFFRSPGNSDLLGWLLEVGPAIQPPHLFETLNDESPVPSPDAFVPLTDMPEMIHSEPPRYPREAVAAHKGGIVWVKALVSTEGLVQDIRLGSPSNTGFDFEATALAAALKNIYKPARQNGKPVAVWVTYPVEFRLK